MSEKKEPYGNKKSLFIPFDVAKNDNIKYNIPDISVTKLLQLKGNIQEHIVQLDYYGGFGADNKTIDFLNNMLMSIDAYLDNEIVIDNKDVIIMWMNDNFTFVQIPCNSKWKDRALELYTNDKGGLLTIKYKDSDVYIVELHGTPDTDVFVDELNKVETILLSKTKI